MVGAHRASGRDRQARQRGLPAVARRPASPGRARNADGRDGARRRGQPAGGRAGAGAAGEAVLAIAEMLEAPVVSFVGGKGIVDDRHYLAQSAVAGHALWRTADAVLAVGTRLNQPLTRWGIDENLQLIRIDIDPVEIGRVARPAVGIVAEAQQALAALHPALARRNPKRPSRKDELAALKART